MVSSVQSYIRSLNWNYRVDVKTAGVTYQNAYGQLLDANTVQVILNN